MDLPLQGSCVCELIQFQIDSEPLFIHACHCNNCQKITGSAFAMSMFLLDKDLQQLSGEPISIDQPTSQGSRKVFLCPACQTVVWAQSAENPHVRIIRPGVLSNKLDITPQAHIWVHRRQAWLRLDDTTPQFDGNYDQAEVWPASSLSRLPAPVLL